MTAAKMPEEAAGTTTLYVVCQRVLPSAAEPNRSSLGTACSASSEIETIVGRASTPTMMPAANAVRPVSTSKVSLTHGTRRARPMRPSTTEGIAAMNSTTDLLISLNRGRCELGDEDGGHHAQRART